MTSIDAGETHARRPDPNPAPAIPAWLRGLGLLALIGGFMAAWTTVATISDATAALHHDTVEAYVWGQSFQLGYFKHPPFWAWVAGLWFSVFPRANWAAYLLCVTNTTIGLAGAWRLVGCFATGDKRVAATVLLLATPFYTLMAMVFNANSIFYSIWPWTLFFFVRSLDRERLSDAVMFGVLVGVAALSKYFAVVLAGGCILSLPFHPRGWAWLRSASPWIAAVIASVLFAPHLWWLIQNDFPTIAYFRAEAGRSFAFTLGNVASMPFEWLASLAIVGLIAVFGARMTPRALRENLRERAREPRFRFIVALLAFPLILTLLAGLAFQAKLATNWTEAAFPLAPLVVLEMVGGDMNRIKRLSVVAVVAITVLALAVSPAIQLGLVSPKAPNRTDPRRELALEATRQWRQAFGAPVPIVAGTFPFDEAIAFYSADRPSAFIDFDPQHAPWITKARLAQNGLLVACLSNDNDCLREAQAFSTPQTRRSAVVLTHDRRFNPPKPMSFSLFLTPPHITAASRT